MSAPRPDLRAVSPPRRIVFRRRPTALVFLSLFMLPALSVAAATADTTATRDSRHGDVDLYHDETEFHLVTPQTAKLVLAHGFIDPTSCRLSVEGRLWQRDVDYRLRARSGEILPLGAWAPAGAGPALVRVSYRFAPVPLAMQLELHEPALAPEGAVAKPDRGTDTAAPRTDVPAVGDDLLVRGSKSVQFASGSRRELTVDQNLRLNIAGQLTPEITVNAFLSDDNLPVVPEGNTEELRDIDKVLVQLRAPTWQATLGDFVAQRSGSVFGGYRRKLQGMTLTVDPGAVGGSVLAGSPRGAYRLVEIRGQEANQGPYFLGGGDAGDNLFIVAGSERVTVDGERMTRGADKDYVIDYVRGSIVFTYSRLITAESTIVVEFEEGEGQYGRSVVGAGADAAFSLPGGNSGAGRLRVTLTRERDDPNRLRTGELDVDDLAVLAAAGDRPELALTGGVFAVEQPGEGSYRRETVGGVDVYVYDTQTGTYDLSFYHVGSGLGDYAIDSITANGDRIYVYQGPGQGNYLIGRPLALPEQQSLLNLVTTIGDSNGVLLNGEWNVSARDRNQLSGLDDHDNSGTGASFSLSSGSRELSVGERALGRLSLQARHERRDADFQPFMARKNRFSYERWGLAGRASREGFLEQSDAETEVAARYAVGDAQRGATLFGRWGDLQHGDGLAARQRGLDAEWRWSGLRGTSTQQAADARDSEDPLDVSRRAYSNAVVWQRGPIVPSVNHRVAWWRDDLADTASAAGSRHRSTKFGLASNAAARWRWRLDFERGLADSLRAGAWRLERDSRTVGAVVATPNLGGVRLAGNATVRRIRQAVGDEQTTRLAKVDAMGRWPDMGSDWSVSYAVDNSRTEVLRRQVVFVGLREGDYNQEGDFVGLRQGDYNLEMVGTDSLVATTAVVADLSWRQDFGFLGRDAVYGAWALTTRCGVEGRSRTKDVGSLLRLQPTALFAADDAVLGTVSLSEELALLRHLRHLDLRLKFDYAQARDRQYAGNPEDRLDRQYQVVATWSASARNSLQIRGTHDYDSRLTAAEAASSQRSYRSLARRGEIEWSWRPVPGSNVATAVELIWREDAVSGVEQAEQALHPSSRFRLYRQWSGQIDLRLSRVESREPTGAIRPYFFAFPGTNFEASARLGWDPTKHLKVALVLASRRFEERGWQHDVRMESTARF